nr:DNA replication licensing factor MCM2 [Tanacetum cinerariifolium]
MHFFKARITLSLGRKVRPNFCINKLSTAKVVGRSCSHCQSQGPFTVISEKIIYNRYQKLTLQSRHHLVSPARVPISIEVILLDELIGCAHLGQEIEITGIYTKNYGFPLAAEHEFSAYAKVFEANYVANKQERLYPYLLNDSVKEQVLHIEKTRRL